MKIANLLAQADIQINGSRPWDLQVHNDSFYQRVLAQGSLGFGESYMDGRWDCEDLDEMLNKIFQANLTAQIKPLNLLWPYLKAKVLNQQRRARAYNIGEKHYDIGNDLYQAMLGQSLTYTCGYWAGVDNLDAAQAQKLDLVCRKIGLRPGQKVLDIGCGWGSFAKFAAQKYGAQVVGITVSKEQAELARKFCAGLPVEIRLQDYREVNEQFDHIISLGMLEHVGAKNYRTYMQIVAKNLKPDGLFLLHTIGGNKSVTSTNPWIHKYIFPDSMLPSAKQLTAAWEKIFVMEDWHNFGPDYDKTLLAWYKNFNEAWPQLKDKYGERFYRMWRFYLLSCAGSFRARKNQLWQIVLSRGGVKPQYQSIR